MIIPGHSTCSTELIQCCDNYPWIVHCYIVCSVFPVHSFHYDPCVCSLMETELTSLCQSVLEDFNLVLFYLPPPSHAGAHHPPSEEEEEQQLAESSCPLLPDSLVFKMVITCLMVVHSLKRGG